jgi:O-methyltransferase
VAHQPRRLAPNALLDFRAVHGIEDEAHTMHDIDGTGAWFRKSREVPLLRDRYLKSLSIEFQPMNWRSRAANVQKLLQPHPPLSAKNYVALRQQHEKWTGGEEERNRINSLRLDT